MTASASRDAAVRHSARAAPALAALVEEDPAIAALSLWCAHRDGPATGTRGSTITYGPDFPDLPAHEQRGLAAHHVLHVALRHSARLSDMAARLGDHLDADRWNLAADALVNEALLLAGHALPRPAVTLTGLLADAGRPAADAATALAEWDVDRLYHALAATSDGTGSDARRGFAPDLSPEAGEGSVAEGEDARADADARWRQHLARALDAGRRAGRGLGTVGHRIADIPVPRTPWELVLRGLLSRAVTVAPHPAPTRPARRWLAATAEAARAGTASPGFQPGTRPHAPVPRIAVALDASGSIDDARLALFWAEVTGIARRLRAELHLIVFDDAVRHQIRVEPGAAPVLPPLPRGGGTAFAPPVAAAQALGAAILVVLTDLDGEAGPAPRLPVIWAVPEPGGPPPPFGRLLDLSR